MIQGNSSSLFSETMPHASGGATMNPGAWTPHATSGTSALWYSFRDHQVDCGPAGRNDEYRTRDSQLRLCEPSLRARPRCVEAERTHCIPVGYEGGCFPGAIDRG